MIPRKLQLKNFLSYGSKPQMIDFSSYHLICLSGKNGHGKSALLDAITWALWGTARKAIGGMRGDADLVYLGQTTMIVIFDFEFNGNCYRVRREYIKHPTKPSMSLDFGVFDAQQQKFSPLTEKTIRNTQAIIESTLHLTFESFINSAFLRQGQSNEFSKKSPKDRKNILANILGLDHYESVRKLATEKAKRTAVERDTLSALVTTLNAQLQQAQLAEQYAALLTTLSTMSNNEHALEEEKKELATMRSILVAQKKEEELLNKQQQRLFMEQESHRHTLRSTFKEWRTIHAQCIKTDDRQTLEQQKHDLTNKLYTYQQLLQTQLTIKEKLLQKREELRTHEQKKQEISVAKIQAKKISIERLAIEKSTLEKSEQELKRTHAQCMAEKKTLDDQINKTEQDIGTIERETAHNTALIAQFEKRKQYYQTFSTQAQWITKEIETITHKQQSIHDENNPSCPLCEQNLSASRKRFLKQNFIEQETVLHHRLERLKKVILQLKAVLIQQHEQYKQIQAQKEKLSALKIHLESFLAERIKLTQRSQELEAQQGRFTQELLYKKTLLIQEEASLQQWYAQEQQSMTSDPECATLKQMITQLDKQLLDTVYDPQAHQDLLRQLQQIDQQLISIVSIQEQRIKQEQRKQIIVELSTQLKKIKRDILHTTQALKIYAHHAEQDTQLKTKEEELQKKILTCNHEKNIMLQDKGRLEQQMVTQQKIEQEHAQHTQRIGELATIIDDYYLIAQATGKDGVQALLIEDAIPEIEHEANGLLAKLTNNQAHISIESLKDLKKGGTKETLDIKISDAIGIRPYELFSGGEAFRIDFALRIAISKLLARRSGASLQTLIIDEGFGSQDEEGLGHMMDAIHAIQDDFAKVIIVSHLATMKDQFPVHFFVEKGTQGSIVQVIEQG